MRRRASDRLLCSKEGSFLGGSAGRQTEKTTQMTTAQDAADRGGGSERQREREAEATGTSDRVLVTGLCSVIFASSRVVETQVETVSFSGWVPCCSVLAV